MLREAEMMIEQESNQDVEPALAVLYYDEPDAQWVRMTFSGVIDEIESGLGSEAAEYISAVERVVRSGSGEIGPMLVVREDVLSRTFDLDGYPTTFAQFALDNAESIDVVLAAAALHTGEMCMLGGGASAIAEIRRVS